MFEYKICNVYDKNIFSKQCTAIKQHIPNIAKDEILSDVDGSQLQIYTLTSGEKIKVRNSMTHRKKVCKNAVNYGKI